MLIIPLLLLILSFIYCYTVAANEYTCIAEARLCFAGQYLPSIQQIEITAIFPSEIRWVGLGIGNSLDTANLIVIFAPNGDELQLAQVYRDNGNMISLDASMFSIPKVSYTNANATQSKLVFRRPVAASITGMQSWPSGSSTYYWAIDNSSAPIKDASALLAWTSSSESTSVFKQGTFNADFGEFSVPVDTLPEKYIHYLTIHGALMFTAWAMVLPLGIFIARFMKRVLGPYWFPVHWILMGVVTSSLTVAGIVYAYKARSLLPVQQPPVSTHGIIGYVLLSLYICQIVCGIVIDRLWNPYRLKTPWQDKCHWWLGRTVALLALAVVIHGLVRYDQILGRQVVLYGVIICILWILILEVIGFTVLRRGQPKYGKPKQHKPAAQYNGDTFSKTHNIQPPSQRLEPQSFGADASYHLPTVARTAAISQNYKAPPSPTKRNNSIIKGIMRVVKNPAILRRKQSIANLIPERTFSRRNFEQRRPSIIYPKESIYDQYLSSSLATQMISKDVSLVPLPANQHYNITPYNKEEQIHADEHVSNYDDRGMNKLLPSSLPNSRRKSSPNTLVRIISPSNHVSEFIDYY